MKILKPGKVERRKFVCPACECEFVATVGDTEWWGDKVLYCPTRGTEFPWENGEPYEEPVQDMEADTARLVELLRKTDELPWPVTTQQIAEFLITNGVTFRE